MSIDTPDPLSLPASEPASARPPPMASEPAAASGATVPPAHPPRHDRAAGSGGLWLGILALLLAVGALVVAGMLWQRLSFTQKELTRRNQESATLVVEARTLASQAEALTHELKARLSVAEIKLSEVSLQRSQLEELMLSVSRTRDDNLVQDIDSALRLALQQTQLTGSAQPLLSALQAAEERIGRAAQPRLNPVQRAIARDIESIQGASLTDVPSLVRRMDELTRQADTWPLLNQPLRLASAEPAVEAGITVAAEPSPDDAIVNASPGWNRIAEGWNHFWRRVWTNVTQTGRELVRVSRIDQPDAALLAPEQAFFLRENLKLKLLNARLGLLARQTDAAQADLVAASAALERYFDVADPAVSAALVTLGQLGTELAVSELPRPDESLAALATAAGGR